MSQLIMKVYIGNTPPNHCLMMMGHRQNTFFLPRLKDIRIRTYPQSADTTKKIGVPKKGSPLEPRYTGMCTFSTKTFETLTHAIETRARTILCLYQNHQNTIQDSRLI
jgi:hypothetical protein